MQSKDIISKPLDTEWAIVKWDASVRKDVKASGLVHWASLEKATLVSTDRYVVDKNKRSYDPNDSVFVRQIANGSFGYLVKGEPDDSGTRPQESVYRVVPATDFISPWADKALEIEMERTAEANARAEAQVEAQRRQAIYNENNRRNDIAKEVAVDMSSKFRKMAEKFINDNIPADLLPTCDVSVYGDTKGKPNADGIHTDYDPFLNGTIRMSPQAFEMFMQVFIDLQG